MKSSKRVRAGSYRVTCLVGLFIIAGCLAAHGDEEETPVELFMEDGQLFSHPLRVFVTRDLKPDQQPKLQLLPSHAVTKPREGELDFRKTMAMARNQQHQVAVEGEKVSYTGTLMLFDLSRYPIPWYKAAMRVTPVLTWTGSAGATNEAVRTIIGTDEVYVASVTGAVGWTVAVAAVLLAFILLIIWQRYGSAAYLFVGIDGHLSLWKVQIAAWTVAVGAAVLCYALTRLEVPKIPDSLVALMGLSLATGGLSYLGSKKRETALKRLTRSMPREPRLSDLIMDFSAENPEGTLSIARVQMLFWTCLMLVVFVVKSLMDSLIWEVPWEMVALMGLSQAGYVSPKLVERAKDEHDEEELEETVPAKGKKGG